MKRKQDISNTFMNQSDHMESMRLLIRGFSDKGKDIMEHYKFYVIITLKQIQSQLVYQFHECLTVDERYKLMRLTLDSCV